MRRNIAGQTVGAQLIARADGTDVTSGTVTVQVQADDSGAVAGAGTVSHKASGLWIYLPSQAETNAARVSFTFSHPSAITTTVQLYPVAWDPSDGRRLGLTALPDADAGAAGGLPLGNASGEVTVGAYGTGQTPLQPSTAGRTLEVDANGDVRVSAYATGAAPLQPLTAGRQIEVDAAGNVRVGAYAAGQAPLQPAVAGRTLNVSVAGSAGINWNAIENPGTAVALQNTTIAWNSLWDIPAQAASAAALAAIFLDQLLAQPAASGVNGSYLANMASDTGMWSDFNRTLHSLRAIRIRGDAAWITGGASALTRILTVEPSVPALVDVADTGTYRVALHVRNALGAFPSTAEITAGTIAIDRRADGATAWTPVLADTACSVVDGVIYRDVAFAAGSYASNDTIRYVFKNQRVTWDAQDYEISDATGRMYYSAVLTGKVSLQVVLDVPDSIALDASNPVRIAYHYLNSRGTVPLQSQITPGTITIDRRALGSQTWIKTVDAAPMTAVDGGVYFDHVFSSTPYAEGDTIRVSLAGQTVTIANQVYEIDSGAGREVYSEIRRSALPVDNDAIAAAVLARAVAGNPAGSLGFTVQATNTTIGTAGAGLTDLGGLSTGARAEVRAEVVGGLGDTNTATQPATDAKIDALENLSQAQAQAATDAALIAYDTAKQAATDAKIDALNNVSVSDILNTPITEGYAAKGAPPTIAQALSMLTQRDAEITIVGTTLTVRGADGTTPVMTYTLDSPTAPTAITRAT